MAKALHRWKQDGQRKKDNAMRAIRHALNGQLARGWRQWRSLSFTGKSALHQKALAYFISKSTVGAWHLWCKQFRAAEAAMHLTFASAAAILPIAAQQSSKQLPTVEQQRVAARQMIAYFKEKKVEA